MNSDTTAKLIAINREFYDRFGESFSATRQRLQPGVMRILESLNGDEKILDLGCGNGELARVLAKRGHRSTYLGLDFSLPLLRDAGSHPEGFSATFAQADLTSPSWSNDLQPSIFDLVFSFAVFHHIPSDELRLNIFRKVHDLLALNGRFILSNWQFLNSEKLKARIKPWEAAAVSSVEVDAGDYLLDWRSGGEGLRYAHHFTAEELSAMAERSGFRVKDSFLSDGEGGNLGLYQVWENA